MLHCPTKPVAGIVLEETFGEPSLSACSRASSATHRMEKDPALPEEIVCSDKKPEGQRGSLKEAKKTKFWATGTN